MHTNKHTYILLQLLTDMVHHILVFYYHSQLTCPAICLALCPDPYPYPDTTPMGIATVIILIVQMEKEGITCSRY